MFGATLCDEHACALRVVVQAAVMVQVNGGCDGLGFQVVLCIFDVMALYKALVVYLLGRNRDSLRHRDYSILRLIRR